jgi:hypothetical protein
MWENIVWAVFFGLPIAIGGLAMSLNPPEFTVARVCFIIAALVLLARFSWWISIEQQRISGILLISSLTAAFFLIGLFLGSGLHWINKRKLLIGDKTNSQMFSVEVRSAFVSDSGPLTLFMVGYPSIFGQTASPVFYLTYLQITNLQNVTSTINELKVAASKESNGPWEDLVPIPLGSVALYMLDGKASTPKKLMLRHETYRLAKQMTIEGMKCAMPLSAQQVLDSELSKPIQSHGTVSGWTAFDSRLHKGLTPGQIYFRITIRDTNNNIESNIVSLPIQPDSSIHVDAGSIFASGQVIDISRYKVRYYSDPIPTSKSSNK